MKTAVQNFNVFSAFQRADKNRKPSSVVFGVSQILSVGADVDGGESDVRAVISNKLLRVYRGRIGFLQSLRFLPVKFLPARNHLLEGNSERNLNPPFFFSDDA